MKIGVIDGVLVKNKITKFANVIKYGIFNGKVENIKDEKISYNMTHSTSCCVTLQNFLRNPSKHSLLHINIIKNCQLDIENFIIAIRFLADKRIDILCLSIGTTRISNADRIYSAIKELNDKGVFIISASSNANLVTYPAAFEEVVGSVTLPKNVGVPLSLYNIPKNGLGIDIGITTERFLSNSYSSPMILAQLLNVMEDEFNVKEGFTKIISRELKCPKKSQLNLIKSSLFLIGNDPLPIIIIEKEKGESYDVMKKIMMYLADFYNYESVCVLEDNSKYNSFQFINFSANILHDQLRNKFNRDIDLLFLSSGFLNDVLNEIYLTDNTYIKISRTKITLCLGEYHKIYHNNINERIICNDIVFQFLENKKEC